jgi:hypothetical protein
MNITEFWEVFGEKLHLAAQQIKVFNQEKVPLLSLKCEYLYTRILTLSVVIVTCCYRNIMDVQSLSPHVVQPGSAIEKNSTFLYPTSFPER